MKILYVLHDSSMTGAAWSLLDMIEFGRDQFQAIAIVPNQGEIENYLLKLNVKSYFVPYKIDKPQIGAVSEEGSIQNFINNYEAALKIKEIIQQEKVQIVHTNSGVSNVGIMAAVMAGVKHVWHIREFLEEDFGCTVYDREFKRDLFRCSDAVITITQCVREAYLMKYDLDSECIYDGFNIERYKRNYQDEYQDKQGFILAGTISQGKGQTDAIRAVEKLIKTEGKKINLWIVGNGSTQYLWVLNQYIKKRELSARIHILPFMENLEELRVKCKFSLTTSRMEALGRVTVEAMIARNIVIGADTGGTAELIGKDETKGYLYRQGDSDDLARVMNKAIAENKRNAEILDSAQKFAVQSFDVNDYINKIIDIYERILNNQDALLYERRQACLRKIEARYFNLKSSDVQKNHADVSVLPEVKSSGEIWKMLLHETERWLHIKQDNVSFEEVLLKRDIRTIAIYGMGHLGCNLFSELIGSNIEIKYVIDRKWEEVPGILKVVTLDGEMPHVDLIIITVLREINEIKEALKKKCEDTAVSISELLSWCEENE